MCPSVPTHIHPYISKLRLLLKTDDETNGLCLQLVHAFTGSWSRVFRCWCKDSAARCIGGESYCMPIQECNKR